MIGTQLLHYEITAHLGAGGMGEVYRARDTRLGRSVAIKVLPELLARDPERVARFEREARLLASLNHPSIASLYGLESLDTRLFLVMELVEGVTLAEHLARRTGPLGPPGAPGPEGPVLQIDDALAIARQIAEALESAHEKGIIHRDLKPANVKITPDGKVKVLDFGLAKAMEGEAAAADVSNSPTLSLAATRMGVILGTAAYMAPEQAKAKAVDKRADIWSFGCVLFEMLGGRPPFDGETVSETLADVIKSEPPWDALPADLAPRVANVLRRCLEKDPSRRLRDIGDVRLALDGAFDVPIDAAQAHAPAARPFPLWRRALPLAATALATAGIAAVVAWTTRPAPVASITRFSIALPDGQLLTRTGRHNIAVSPDGQHIVYVANNQLYIRGMGDLEATPVQGTNQDVNTPFFSPDGQWIGFNVVPEAKLKKIAITGGASVTIADVDNLYGASWGPDNQILVGQGTAGIVRVSANGGTPETVVKAESGEVAHGPQMLPDGNHVLFTLTKGTGATRWDQAHVVVQSLRTGERQTVINGGSDARYVPTGHIVYALGADLLAVPFDDRSLTVTGGPVPVVEGIGRAAAVLTAAMFFSASESGTLAYFTGGAINAVRDLTVALADRKSASVPLKLPPQPYTQTRISPDGRQLAMVIAADNESNIWIYDLASAAAPRRLTFGGSNTSPAWTPDGRRIVFISYGDDQPSAIFWQPADGSSAAERLTDPKVVQPTELHISPRSNQVTFQQNGRIWMLPLDGDRKPQLLIDVPMRSTQEDAALSPDGRWIVYTSSESTRSEVYVQSFPLTGSKYQVTTTGAHDPRWSPDGRQIFYLRDPDHALMSVDVRTNSGFAVSNPTLLLESVRDGPGLSYDVMPDGRQFVVITGPRDAELEAGADPEIRVTLNWFEELRQRVPP